MPTLLVIVVAALAASAPGPIRAAEAPALLEVGDAFPAWSMRDHTGATVTSQALAGKPYLLWYYPKAQTPGCTMEGRGIRDRFSEFRDKKVEVVGVSFDDPAANAAFVQAEGFPFRLLSDTDRALAKKVGAVASDDAPVARRVSYLVGADGKVQQSYGDVTPATHAADVISDLQ
jgi:peroxiredoxin Q/BCP